MAKRRLDRDDQTGQFSEKKPPNKQLVKEQSGAQRQAADVIGVWQGIPGQGGSFMGDYYSAGMGGMGLGILFPGGGGVWNPMGFPGYGMLYGGNPLTYRWMLQHPILRLVRAIDVSVIAANTWEYEKADEKVPDEWTTLIQRMFDKLRPRLLADYFVRGRDYGWAAGEPIWELDENDNYYYLRRVKPMLNDVTRILQDEHGNFTGLRNSVSIDKQTHVDIPAPFKAWKYTYDSEAGYHYGRSWLENVRATAWVDWLDTAQQLQKLTGKISGIISVILSPAGTFPGPIDPSTNKPTTVSYRDNAEKTIQALANGAAGVWFPSLGLVPDAKGNLDAMKVLVELAGKSLTKIEVLDFSGQTAAIAPLIERMRHDEELMFAGGLRSAQTGLEPHRGQKAMSEEHTDTGTLNAEVDDRDFASQVQALVDAALVVNFGERARGRVLIKCPSLVDRKAAVLKAFMLALMNEPSISRESSASADLSKIYKALGIPQLKPFDGQAVLKLAEEQMKARLAGNGGEGGASGNDSVKKRENPDPQGGRPPAGESTNPKQA